MQEAIIRGVVSGIWGASQQFNSLLYTDVCGESQQEEGQHEFPYDVKYLTRAGLAEIKKLATTFHHEVWEPERIQAYQGKNLIAKRAAVSTFLWKRYCDEPKMSMERLKLWYEIEELDKILTQVPTWFQNQHIPCDNIKAVWRKYVGGHRWKLLEEQHRATMQKLLR